jgi:protein TonB
MSSAAPEPQSKSSEKDGPSTPATANGSGRAKRLPVGAELIFAPEPSKERWAILGTAIAVAAFVHGGLLAGGRALPVPEPQERIEMAIYEPPPPPPPPEPEPEPEPEPPKEKPKPPEPKKKPPKPPPEAPPPPSNSEPQPDVPEEPPLLATGISMESTVKGSGGPSFRVGNTTYGDPNKEKFVDPNKLKPYTGGKKGWKPVRAAAISKGAVPIKKVKPKYPDKAYVAGVEGKITMRCQVRKDGTVRNARVIKGLGHGLDEAALAAVKKWKFSPAIKDGEKVDSEATCIVTFELFD